jgi:hypothetical protein
VKTTMKLPQEVECQCQKVTTDDRCRSANMNLTSAYLSGLTWEGWIAPARGMGMNWAWTVKGFAIAYLTISWVCSLHWCWNVPPEFWAPVASRPESWASVCWLLTPLWRPSSPPQVIAKFASPFQHRSCV